MCLGEGLAWDGALTVVPFCVFGTQRHQPGRGMGLGGCHTGGPGRTCFCDSDPSRAVEERARPLFSSRPGSTTLATDSPRAGPLLGFLQEDDNNNDYYSYFGFYAYQSGSSQKDKTSRRHILEDLLLRISLLSCRAGQASLR